MRTNANTMLIKRKRKTKMEIKPMTMKIKPWMKRQQTLRKQRETRKSTVRFKNKKGNYMKSLMACK